MTRTPATGMVTFQQALDVAVAWSRWRMVLDVWERLTEWRRAERLRDELAVGSPAWQEADDEARRAHTAYRAEIAQVAARHGEADAPEHRHFWSPLHGRAAGSGGVAPAASDGGMR